MATVFDVAHADIIDIDANVTGVTVNTVDVIEVPTTNTPATVTVVVAGPQGPAGLQNVFVQPTPPDNPQVNWIWIDTSS